MKKKTIKHFGQGCTGPSISDRRLRKLHRKLTQEKELKDFLTLFQLLGGKTRLQILYLLYQQKSSAFVIWPRFSIPQFLRFPISFAF